MRSFIFFVRGGILPFRSFTNQTMWMRWGITVPRWTCPLVIRRAESSHRSAQTTPRSPRPSGYWNDEQNQRQFIENLAQQLRITERKEEWPQLLSKKLIYENGGATLYGKYKGLRPLLEHLFPSTSFQFPKPRYYWTDLSNQRTFLEEEMKRRHMTHLDDWYSVDVAEFRRAGGRSLLAQYPTFFHMLEAVFPEHAWDTSKRKQRPRGFWKNVENRRAFVRQRVHALGLDQLDDWSHVTCSELFGPEARRLSEYYPNYQAVLEDCYPEKGQASLKKKPKNYWKDLSAQRSFFDAMGEDLGVEHLSDWNDVRTSDILKMKQGAWVFKYYNSLADALRHVYPEVDWDELDRIRVPRHYWDDQDHAQAFLRKVETKLKIKEPEDWYRVSLQQIRELGGGGLVVRYGGLLGLLSHFYPEVYWNVSRLTMRGKRAAQRWLFLEVQRLFPGEEVVEDFLYSAERESGLAIEFDVFVPSYRLALEYQGYHHYNELPAFGSLELYQQRDEEKQQLAARHQISLVAVPFSWDNSLPALQELIRQQCPSISFPTPHSDDK